MYRYIEWTWVGVGIVWVLAAMGSKRTARREGPATRLLHLAIMTVAFALLFWPRLSLGPLAWRILPRSQGWVWAGLALTLAGCAFAIRARLLLGGNWSGSVAVKQDHQLMRRGPYAFVRHPIYSGFLLGLAGVAVAGGELRGFLGWALMFVGWGVKARMEEAFMVEQFGAAYLEYAREVKALIPFVL